LFGIDARGLLARWGLPRDFLSCNFLSRSFLALGFLSRGLGLFIELPSDGPEPLFPFCLLLFGIDARGLLARWGLPRDLLSCNFLSRSFLALGLPSCGLDTGRLLTSCFLPLRLQFGGCLSRGFDLVGGPQVGDRQFNDLSERRVGGPFGTRERSRSTRTGRGVLRWLGFCRWTGRWNDC
jgi:hypothetical protein